MKTNNSISKYFSIFSQKSLLLVICSVLLFATNVSGKGYGSVIGHAVAEVVDGSSISSNVICNHAFNSADAGSDINLGKITVKPGSTSSYEIVVKPATLTNKDGSSLVLEAKANNLTQQQGNSYNPKSALDLSGSTNTLIGHSGTYLGSFTIVLPYN